MGLEHRRGYHCRSPRIVCLASLRHRRGSSTWSRPGTCCRTRRRCPTSRTRRRRDIRPCPAKARRQSASGRTGACFQGSYQGKRLRCIRLSQGSNLQRTDRCTQWDACIASARGYRRAYARSGCASCKRENGPSPSGHCCRRLRGTSSPCSCLHRLRQGTWNRNSVAGCQSFDIAHLRMNRHCSPQRRRGGRCLRRTLLGTRPTPGSTFPGTDWLGRPRCCSGSTYAGTL